MGKPNLVERSFNRTRRRRRDAQLAVKWAYQRVVRGWDDRALWSIDSHLTKTLGEQLVSMARTAHGSPGDDYPYERWTADLKRHGEALLTYSRTHHDVYGDDWEAWEAVYGPAREALAWVAENLAALWD